MSADRILAFTCSHGDRRFLPSTVPAMRATAGCWFDWVVVLGEPSPTAKAAAEALLKDPEGTGIQYLKTWPENRGQHHAFAVALDLARKEKYDWLLPAEPVEPAVTGGRP